jgi:hypothetical protein
MADASFRDVLQDRTHKYRRSLIAICVVLIAIYWLPNLNFEDLSLFGVKPGVADYNPRLLVVWSLWVLWTYHAALFFYYTQRDYKDWRAELRKENAFPEILMYFWWRPSQAATRKRIAGVENWSWTYSGRSENKKWVCTYKVRNEAETTGTMFSVHEDAVRSVRSRIAWGLALVDFGVPFVLSLLAVSLALLAHFVS